MLERLGIVEERQANRLKYGWRDYVAPQDRVGVIPTPRAIKPAPPPVRITIGPIRARGSNNWRKTHKEAAKVRIKNIIHVTADVFDVRVDDLSSEARSRHLAFPRFAAMHLLNKVLRLSTPSIGELFKRDHTTVLSAIARAAYLRRTDKSFALRSRLIARRLRSMWASQ